MHIWNSSLATVPSICDSYVKIDNDCTHDYNMTFYCELAAKGWMKTITQIQTHRQVGLLFAVGRLYGKTLQQVVGWTFIRTLTPVLMKLNGSLWLRLYNEKSDIIRPYYSLTQRSRSTSSTMYCVICKLNVSTRTLRPTTIAKIRLRTDCCNAFPNFFQYGSESSREWSSMERKFLGHSLLRSESSAGAKIPWNESSYDFSLHGSSSTERKFHGNESSIWGLVFQKSGHAVHSP